MNKKKLIELRCKAWGITETEYYCNQCSDFSLEDMARAYRRGKNKGRADLEKENAELRKGAEFGYNKGNEWHYVKDGDLPKENEYIMIYSKLADNIAVGKRRCAGKIRKRCVYEWYFATYEGTYCLRDKDIIAWKEIDCKGIKEK